MSELTVQLTLNQCRNVADFIDDYILQAIRQDTDIDCTEWVKSMLDAMTILREAVGVKISGTKGG